MVLFASSQKGKVDAVLACMHVVDISFFLRK